MVQKECNLNINHRYVFGGSIGIGSIKNDSNSLHYLDLDTWTWYTKYYKRRTEEISPYVRHIPKARSGHAMVEINGNIYMYCFC